MPLVMDGDRMAKTLTRIAHEIVERNRGVEELALVGIRSRGVPLARRLARSIKEISGHDVPTGALDITLYRDDLMRHAVGAQPVVKSTDIPFSIDDRRILLVDDVLYTGRTIRAAAPHPAGGARRPRPPRAADQGRLRRQEHSDLTVAERTGPAHGSRRTRRSGGRGMKKDLLGIADLSSDEIYRVLDTAEAMREIGERPIKKVPTLRGKTIVNLFYEPSTRTRTSFEIAEKRLSADTLNIAVAASSVLKGETLADTAMNIEAMAPDMIVLRHASSGACHLLARICRSKIINAGDGMHEHPTQALLDAFTIRQHKHRIDGLKVAIVGDLLHSRVLRSNALLLTKLGADVWVSGPPTLVPPGIERLGVHVTTSVDQAVADADVIMMLRIQQERMQGAFFPSLREYYNVFGLTTERVGRARGDVIIMHPGPMNRGVEIASEVADGPYSVILEQVANGVAVRMAVLYLLAGEVEAD
jgi:aspartate carbamoyltransferase catalytic subunit